MFHIACLKEMIYDFAKRESDEQFWCPTKFSKNPKCKAEKTKLEEDWTDILPLPELVELRAVREKRQKQKLIDEKARLQKQEEESRAKKEKQITEEKARLKKAALEASISVENWWPQTDRDYRDYREKEGNGGEEEVSYRDYQIMEGIME